MAIEGHRSAPAKIEYRPPLPLRANSIVPRVWDLLRINRLLGRDSLLDDYRQAMRRIYHLGHRTAAGDRRISTDPDENLMGLIGASWFVPTFATGLFMLPLSDIDAPWASGLLAVVALGYGISSVNWVLFLGLTERVHAKLWRIGGVYTATWLFLVLAAAAIVFVAFSTS